MTEKNVEIPDIGGATDVDVIEILVTEGQSIEQDESLVTLESDKASMEIPSPSKGVVKSIKIKLGDKVSEGDVILTIDTESGVEDDAGQNNQTTTEQTAVKEEAAPAKETEVETPVHDTKPPAPIETNSSELATSEDGDDIFAGPGVRRLAHTLGVSLSAVQGSGRKSRILREDVEAYVKQRLSAPSAPSASGFSMPEASVIDFSVFGEVEEKPLNKIKRLTASNVHRSYISIPHVTQFDESDITALEAFRQSEKTRAEADGYKLTILAFVCKLISQALMKFPQFNASLDATGQNLIYKHYYNIGIAVDTEQGLVVPVIKDVNKLSVGGIAMEMARLSKKAREKKLLPGDMQGGCFTISSLGGIGGTAFTPIVNAPEVAILGLSRASKKLVEIEGEFVPRLMLPLSLSYDHRVIDGAEAARFTRYICEHLSDIRRLLL